MAEDITSQNPAPVASPTPVSEEPVAPPTAASADDQEWEKATDNYRKENGFIPKEEGKNPDEPTKPKQGEQKPPEAKPDPKDQKSDAQSKPGDDTETETDGDKPDEQEEQPDDNPDIRTQRQLQRELVADEDAMKADIRKEMFSDVQTELVDADGDPITTPADVMKLQNPNTGKAFTEEEATAWLLAAQQHLAKQLDEVDKQIESIAQANLDIKDWADAIKVKYGAFIKANPDIWKPIWAEYQGTLVKDEKTNIITKAPVNFERFAEIALTPHLQLAERMQKDAEQAEEAKKGEQNKDRQRTQSDRADVTAAAKPDVRSKDDKEWEQAAKELYEG